MTATPPPIAVTTPEAPKASSKLTTEAVRRRGPLGTSANEMNEPTGAAEVRHIALSLASPHLCSSAHLAVVADTHQLAAATGAPLAVVADHLAIIAGLADREPVLKTVSLATAVTHYLGKLDTDLIGGALPHYFLNPKVRSRISRLLGFHLLTVLPGDRAMSELSQSDYRQVLRSLRGRGFDEHTCCEVFRLLADFNAHACRSGFIDTDQAMPILADLIGLSNGVRHTPRCKRLGGPSALQKLIRNSVVWAGTSGENA